MELKKKENERKKKNLRIRRCLMSIMLGLMEN